MSTQTIPLKILFPSEESCQATLSGVDPSSNFSLGLREGVTLDGGPAVRAAGLSATEVLVHAVVTIGTGVSVKVLSDVLTTWLRKAKQKPSVSIGSFVITSAGPAEIEHALRRTLEPGHGSGGSVPIEGGT